MNTVKVLVRATKESKLAIYAPNGHGDMRYNVDGKFYSDKEFDATFLIPHTYTEDDFEGSGQYLVRTTKKHLTDTGFLCTVMYKVGYCKTPNFKTLPDEGNVMCLISMSDGLLHMGYFDTKGTDNTDKWEFKQFNGKQDLCDYLNENPYKEYYRFATNEELIRVAAHQKWRTK